MATIIGYDVREMWFPYSERWTDEQRRSLLRVDLVKPLSVDRVIWPSVFATDFSLSDSEWWGVPNAFPVPAEFRTNLGLWNNRDAMLRQLNHDRPVWAIAITLAASAGMTGVLTSGHDRIADAVDLAWTLLGYDVAEQRLWSALASSPHTEASAWADKLNEYHLFSALGDARAFAADARRRQPGRAPFEVFGIYKIERTED